MFLTQSRSRSLLQKDKNLVSSYEWDNEKNGNGFYYSKIVLQISDIILLFFFSLQTAAVSNFM
jgi:hypothetical protein